jgi:hypothetical protein
MRHRVELWRLVNTRVVSETQPWLILGVYQSCGAMATSHADKAATVRLLNARLLNGISEVFIFCHCPMALLSLPLTCWFGHVVVATAPHLLAMSLSSLPLTCWAMALFSLPLTCWPCRCCHCPSLAGHGVVLTAPHLLAMSLLPLPLTCWPCRYSHSLPEQSTRTAAFLLHRNIAASLVLRLSPRMLRHCICLV